MCTDEPDRSVGVFMLGREGVGQRAVPSGGHQPIVDRHQRGGVVVGHREYRIRDDAATARRPTTRVQIDQHRERPVPRRGKIDIEQLVGPGPVRHRNEVRRPFGRGIR